MKIRKYLIPAGDFVIAALALSSYFSMFAGQDSSNLLSSRGILALRYFTVDSNLLMALICILRLVFRARAYLRGGRDVRFPSWFPVLHLAGVTGVMITFLTVVFFLSRFMGLAPLFRGVNFHLHLTVPLLSAAFLIADRSGRKVPFSRIIWCSVPVLIYALFYVTNLLVNGIGVGYATNDWYGFGRWGTGMYLPIIVIMCSAAYLTGLVLWKASGGKRAQ